MTDDTVDLANDSESFHRQHEHVDVERIRISSIDSNGKITIANSAAEINTDQFFVATTQGIFPAEQIGNGGGHSSSLKNCIIIQDQATFDNLNLNQLQDLRTVGSNPLIASAQVDTRPITKYQSLKYQWDDSVYDAVLPIRCKNTNGELHKRKFGSGSYSLLLLLLPFLLIL